MMKTLQFPVRLLMRAYLQRIKTNLSLGYLHFKGQLSILFSFLKRSMNCVYSL